MFLVLLQDSYNVCTTSMMTFKLQNMYHITTPIQK